MDVNQLRIVVTVLSFAAFLGIFVWAWSRRRAASFAEAAQLPFVDEVPATRRDRSTGTTAEGLTR